MEPLKLGQPPGGTEANVVDRVSDMVVNLGAPERLAAVRQLVADRPPTRVFDRITALAAELLEVPIVLVTLVEPDRQIFLSSWGLPEPIRSRGETSIEFSICQYAVATRKPFVIANTAADPVLRTNRAVTELGVAAYAGIPLITPAMHAIGTLCVLDVVAREWRDDMLALLADLGKLIEDEIRLHHLEGRLAFEQQWGGVQPTTWRDSL